MPDTLAIPPVTTLSPAGSLRPKNLKDAATQFEALMVSQMLKDMRTASGSGWLGTGEDDSSACMMDLAEEHLAQVLAQQGGLGIARMVVQNLGPDSVPSTGTGSAAGTEGAAKKVAGTPIVKSGS
jgi:flagellar protein FlgJ